MPPGFSLQFLPRIRKKRATRKFQVRKDSCHAWIIVNPRTVSWKWTDATHDDSWQQVLSAQHLTNCFSNSWTNIVEILNFIHTSVTVWTKMQLTQKKKDKLDGWSLDKLTFNPHSGRTSRDRVGTMSGFGISPRSYRKTLLWTTWDDCMRSIFCLLKALAFPLCAPWNTLFRWIRFLERKDYIGVYYCFSQPLSLNLSHSGTNP